MNDRVGRPISMPVYVCVLAALLLLTGFTVSISFIELPGSWHLALGVVIAVCKASLVVLVFMDVWHSQPATQAVIIVTVFWLVAVLLAMTLSDYATRSGETKFVGGETPISLAGKQP